MMSHYVIAEGLLDFNTKFHVIFEVDVICVTLRKFWHAISLDSFTFGMLCIVSVCVKLLERVNFVRPKELMHQRA